MTQSAKACYFSYLKIFRLSFRSDANHTPLHDISDSSHVVSIKQFHSNSSVTYIRFSEQKTNAAIFNCPYLAIPLAISIVYIEKPSTD